VSPAATRTCGWLTYGTSVISARTGIPCVGCNSETFCAGWDGIARPARDDQPLCAGGSAPAPWVPFFARAKKGTKESTPPDGATSPSASRQSRCAPQLAGRCETRLGLEHDARENPGTGCGARARHTGWERTPEPMFEVGNSSPRSARRVPQPAREFPSEPLFESSRVLCGRRVGERPRGRGTQGRGRALRGVFSFGDFSLDKQRKVTCRGSATHKYIL